MTAEPDKVIPLDTFLLGLEQRRGGLGRVLSEDPATTQELHRRLSAEPLPEGVIPPQPATGPTSLPPVAYVLHNRSSLCRACNALTRWSETYALHHIRGHWGHRNARHFVPCAALEWNVPIHSMDIPTSETPFCSQCLSAAQDFVADLPRPVDPKTVLKAATSSPSPTSAKPAAAAPKKFTSSDDLMS